MKRACRKLSCRKASTGAGGAPVGDPRRVAGNSSFDSKINFRSRLHSWLLRLTEPRSGVGTARAHDAATSRRRPRAACFTLLAAGVWLLALTSFADTKPGAAIPRRGGTLRLALDADVASLDAALAFDTQSMPFLMLLYQGLVEYGDGTDVQPALASGWKLSADRKTYAFHLRPGAKFSNGRPLVAADVVYSLERTLDPKTAAPTESYFEGIAGAKEFRAGTTNHLRGVRAPGSDTVEIELTDPDPTFLYILTLPGALVVPQEEVKRRGAEFTSHPVGSGPYILTQWKRGANMHFVRNPFYPRADRQYLDAIDAMVGGDISLHLMMFERGELDIPDVAANPGLPIADFPRIMHSPRLSKLVEKLQAGATDFLAMNVEMPPFDDLRVRQAVNYAINKEKIVRLLHGMAEPAQGILPPTMPGFNTNLVSFPYDPAKARQLLAESGHASGLTVTFWYRDQPSPVPASVEFDLSQVGIKAELKPTTFAQLVDSEERRHTVQFVSASWSQDYPDPSDFLDTMFNGTRITDEGCQNTSFYNSPAVNKLLADAAACPDPAQRLGFYQKAEQAIVTDCPYVPLTYKYTYALHQPWLHGLHLHPVLYFRYERCWKDQ